MSKNGTQVIKWRIRKKYELMQYKGNKCEHCGFDDISVPNAFNFHHTDPSKKDYSISGKSYSFEKLKSEVDKCLLLCTICHARIHAEPFKEMYAEAVRDLTKLSIAAESNAKIRQKGGNKCKRSFCKVCDIPITTGSLYCLFHFNACMKITKRPPKEELLTALEGNTQLEVARMYGVSNTAVRKWTRYYDKLSYS